jgi:hypothetical protein
LTTIDGTPRRAGQTEWRSLRVRYYADNDNKDALILDAVRPLFREFAGKIEQPYFARHWRQGPHLWLNTTPCCLPYRVPDRISAPAPLDRRAG